MYVCINYKSAERAYSEDVYNYTSVSAIVVLERCMHIYNLMYLRYIFVFLFLLFHFTYLSIHLSNSNWSNLNQL